MTHKYLFVTFEGGGNVPPVLGVAKQLIARGHSVHVLTEPCLQSVVQDIGAQFIAFTQHFTRESRSQDLIADSSAKNPLAALNRSLENVLLCPAPIVARETKQAILKHDPNVVVADLLMPGALCAAEATNTLRAVLFHMPEYFPAPGRPAAGPGFLPRNDLIGRYRDSLFTGLMLQQFKRHLASYNEARQEHDLPPLKSASDLINEYHRADLRLIQTCEAFDFPIQPAPANLRYVGPVLDDPDWVESWQNPWQVDNDRPLIVVSLSSTFQNQQASLQRIMTALGKLSVRGLVTLGPAMSKASFMIPDNVVMVKSAPHSLVFPQADLVVTHAGHGTVMRALAHGIPLLCLPMGRDQDDNAARVFYHGTGLRLKPSAGVKVIAKTIQQILENPSYRSKAKLLCQQIRKHSGAERAAEELENLVSQLQ